jgi:Histidine kinase-, DNA gyrase B-, and HSP90-like ATPase
VTMLTAETGRPEQDREQTSVPLEFTRFMPCVLYESQSLVALTYVSETIFDLLGFRRDAVIGWRSFWRECVLDRDFALFEEKFRELDACGSTSFIHRMVNSAGLPVWVSHSLRKELVNGTPLICGCLVPIGSDKRVYALDQNVVSPFVHKLGNHFQLLTLTINSLRKTLPELREAELLQDTVDKAIELTRTFSDCNQLPSWMSEIQLFEVLKAATASRRASFLAKSVRFEEQVDHVLEEMTVVGDPFLLEVAFGQIIETALDATVSGGLVKLEGKVEICNGASSVARLRVIYPGHPVPGDELGDATLPPVSSRTNHDGLGLSVASRFIEMHGGLLRIKTEDGGTEIEISLPLDTTKELSCA